ncbi:MAG: hypothetical protein AVDCRST_MAG13-3423, partial [uncultured Solirubrobacteraceae bacterium]
WRGSSTSRRRSWPSCAKWRCWRRRASQSPRRSGRSGRR